MIDCPSCRLELPAGASRCPACGVVLDGETILPTTPRPGVSRSASSLPALTVSAAEGDLHPGALLADRYRIVALLGRGGMGEVYRADDLRLGQPVALKFLPRALEHDPVRLERFLGEVRTARQVSHPNVCRVYGLVLYEVFSGRRAFEAATIGELRRLHEESHAEQLSSSVRDLEPAIERVIFRCLEKDPSNRPASAIAVAAALPGGDPLAAALAAGETPSPEMVAASGEEGAMRPAVAAAWLAAVLAGLAVTVVLASGSHVRHVRRAAAGGVLVAVRYRLRLGALPRAGAANPASLAAHLDRLEPPSHRAGLRPAGRPRRARRSLDGHGDRRDDATPGSPVAVDRRTSAHPGSRIERTAAGRQAVRGLAAAAPVQRAVLRARDLLPGVHCG